MSWRFNRMGSNPHPNPPPQSELQEREHAPSRSEAYREAGKRAHLLLIFVLLLTACGNGRAQGGAVSMGAVLPLWHSLRGERERILLRLIDRWNQTNPDDIMVVPEYRPTAALHSEIMAVRDQTRLPGLMFVSAMQAAAYARANLLVPLDQFVSNDTNGVSLSSQDINDFYPFVLNAGRTAQGNLIGVPMGGRVRTVFYNRDWLKSAGFESPPTTWAAMSDMCNIAANATRGTLCFAVAEDHTPMEDWLLAYGTRPVSSDGTLMQANVSTALEAINQLAKFLEQRQVYRVINSTKIREDFSAGLTLFAFAWSDTIDPYQTEIKQRANFDWDAMTLPGINGPGKPADVMYESGLWVVTGLDGGGATGDQGAGKALASWKFIRWLLETQQTIEWARDTEELPARKSAQATLDENPVRATVLGYVANGARPVPLLSGWGCVRDTMASGMRGILDGRLITDTLRTVQLTAQDQLGFDCSLR